MSKIFNVGVNPAGMAITSDGKYIFVANNNNYDIPGEDAVSMIHVNKNRVKTIRHSSFNEPYTVTIHDEIAYVTNSGSPSKKGELGSITLISTKTGKVVDVIEDQLLDGPSGCQICGNDYLYVNNYGAEGGLGSGNAKNIVVINLKSRKVIGQIPVALAPAALVSHENYLAVASYVDGNPNTGVVSLFKVKGADYKLVKTIEGLSGPFDIVYSANKKYLYVSNFGSNNFAPFGERVAMIDISQGKVVNLIKVGIQPSGLGVLPNGDVVVTCYNTLYSDPVNYNGLTAGQGTLVYLRDNKIYKTVKTSAAPANIVVSPDGKYTHVSCYIGNVVESFLN